MKVLKFFATDRYNIVDVVLIQTITALVLSGHWIAVLMACIVGEFASGFCAHINRKKHDL